MTDALRPALAASVLLSLLLWETARPFFPLFDRQPRARALHAARNLTLTALNTLTVSLGFVALWSWSASLAETQRLGILHLIDPPPWAGTIASILLLDGWTYAWHRLSHRVPALWRFHRVHHADTRMDVTTAGRFHLGEIALSSLLRVPLILALGISLPQLALYEATMFTLVQFQHANIGLSPWLDRSLSLLIVTPGMHKVHHSRVQRETDSNYTSLFSFWDRLFGTYRTNPDPSSIRFGIDETDPTGGDPADSNQAEPESLLSLMKAPFLPPKPKPSGPGTPNEPRP